MKTFLQKRNETVYPFRKLYYEILNRFHVDNYQEAIKLMSSDLRSIIEDCHKIIEEDAIRNNTGCDTTEGPGTQQY